MSIFSIPNHPGSLRFIIICVVFSYLCKALFSGFFQFKDNFVDGQNNSNYRYRSPLSKPRQRERTSPNKRFISLSHTGQNYWLLIGWDRGHFFLITRALLVVKRAWLLDADWLSTPALSWFPASNGFWKWISQTHRFWVWSKHGYFILTWRRINMQQSTVFWWKSKRIFPTKNVLIRSLKNVWVGTAGVPRSIELQN